MGGISDYNNIWGQGVCPKICVMSISLLIRILFIFGLQNMNTLKKLEYEYIFFPKLKESVNPIIAGWAWYATLFIWSESIWIYLCPRIRIHFIFSHRIRIQLPSERYGLRPQKYNISVHKVFLASLDISISSADIILNLTFFIFTGLVWRVQQTNVLQLLYIIAHEIIVSNSVSEYTHGPWKVSDVCALLMSCISEQDSVKNMSGFTIGMNGNSLF